MSKRLHFDAGHCLRLRPYKRYPPPIRRIRTNPCTKKSQSPATGGRENYLQRDGLRNRRQAPRRVEHQLQVNQRWHDRGMAQPPGQVIDGNAVHQQVAGITVPEGVGANAPAGRKLTLHFRPKSRPLHPSPRRRTAASSQPESGASSRYSRSVLMQQVVGLLAVSVHITCKPPTLWLSGPNAFSYSTSAEALHHQKWI